MKKWVQIGRGSDKTTIMAKEGPKKVMEVMLGVTLVELEPCNDVTAEFAVVRRAYHKQVRRCIFCVIFLAGGDLRPYESLVY